jgi:hypothetical protein
MLEPSELEQRRMTVAGVARAATSAVVRFSVRDFSVVPSEAYGQGSRSISEDIGQSL